MNRLIRRIASWAAGVVIRHPAIPLALLRHRAPIQRDGQVMHRSMQLVIALDERATAPTEIAAMRSRMRRAMTLFSPVSGDVCATDRVVDGGGACAGVPVRIYRPAVGAPPPGTMLYIHGGGWTIGDVASYDALCRYIAAVSRCVVVSVDYRLSPENKFPTGLTDAMVAYEWVCGNAAELGAPGGRVAVMGDSSGGNFAAAVCLEARRCDLPQPTAQCLIYPVLDVSMPFASARTFASGFSLTFDAMEWYREQYLAPDDDWKDERISPLCAQDLSGLPPALIVTAGMDPLRDDGSNYAAALSGAGVDVTYRNYEGMIHGFHAMIMIPAAATATAFTARWVAQRLAAG